MRTLIVAVILAVAAALPTGQDTSAAEWWAPTPRATWQIQFNGNLDPSVQADVFGLDAFDTSARTVRRLHAKGRDVVCYVNAGAWEDWRPDAGRYPAAVKGKPLDGWSGERWLDIRRMDVLGPILDDRLDRCVAKDFDGVEFDNVDGYSNSTGFPLTASDQLRFDRWLADAAHAHGLGVGLKNTLELVDELEPDFDFAIVEQCFHYDECELTAPFVAAGKNVINVEYDLGRRAFCGRAEQLGINAMRKRLELDAWRRAC